MDEFDPKPIPKEEIKKLKESARLRLIRKADRIHRFPGKMNPSFASYILQTIEDEKEEENG